MPPFKVMANNDIKLFRVQFTSTPPTKWKKLSVFYGIQQFQYILQILRMLTLNQFGIS